MSEENHLLPRNATEFEMAVSLAAAQGTELPAHLVSDVTDPWTCPAELLPFLALERSVDLWFGLSIPARAIHIHASCCWRARAAVENRDYK